MNDASVSSAFREPPAPQDFRPRVAFTVGVVGHRALQGADLAALFDGAQRVFAEFAAAVRAFEASERVKSSPAYLPAPPVLRCLSGLAAGADSLMAEAALASGWSVAAVLAFPRGEFEQDFEAEGAAALRALLSRCDRICELDGDRALGPQAYVEVGEFVVEHADVVLALWDGAPARGAGGTADVVARALRAGRPVLTTAPAQPTSWRWLGEAPADMEALAREIVSPARADEFPQAFYEDRLGPSLWAIRTVRAMDRVLACGAPAPSEFSSVGVAAAGAGALKPYFERADRLAIAYGARYRAAGLFRYGLIVPATVAALIGAGGGRMQQVAGNLAEFLILVFLVAFSSARWQAATHGRFVEYRLLAEQLRCAMFLEHFAAPPPWKPAEWTGWLTQAYARANGPASARLDAEALKAAAKRLADMTAEQIAYLNARATRYEVAARRLSGVGIGLSGIGILLSGVRAALLFVQVRQSALIWLNIAALVLPALGPVFLGLLSFNEYRRNAARYRAIAAQLEQALQALDRTPPRRSALLAVANRIALILRNESSDWRTLTRIRSVSAF